MSDKPSALSRRSFLLSTAALPLAVREARAETVTPTSPARLRVGLLSDIHVTNRKPGERDSNEHLRKVLRYFDAQKVDAVLIAGDLFTSGRFSELEIVAETWFEVFPNDCGSDGRHVERLFVTGNHDIDGAFYGRPKGESVKDCAARCRQDYFVFHRDEVWRRLFNEPYEPCFMKTVKGYPFVLRHFPSDYTHWGEREKIGPFLAQHAVELKKAGVFFYCQHVPGDDTVNASWLLGGDKWGNGQDDGTLKKLLSGFPNCICLTGHNHNSLSDERSIWQGEYTAVNCGCLVGWAFAGPGRENGHDGDAASRMPPREMPMFSATKVYQGMLMTVYDNCIRFHRRDFRQDHVLGEDWVVPIGTTARPYAFGCRAKASKAPRFASGAKVGVRMIEKGRDRSGNEHPQVEVTFPSVTSATGGDRAHDYSVRLEMRIGDVIRTMDEKRVFSDTFMDAEQDDRGPVRCLFARSAVPAGRAVRFVVAPINCWMKAGETISSDWRVLVK